MYSMWCCPVQHGESMCNLYGKIGGDSPLSHRGEQVRDIHVQCTHVMYTVHVHVCAFLVHSVFCGSEGVYG